MKIRDTQNGDLQRVLARSSKHYDKLPAPEESEESLTLLDESGQPCLVMKAQRVAELYLAIDHNWETPAMRWAAIEMMHKEMMSRLLGKGYTVGYCFFADGVPNGYIRRLIPLGWNRMIERCIRFVAGGKE